jgi:hypothetical protein
VRRALATGLLGCLVACDALAAPVLVSNCESPVDPIAVDAATWQSGQWQAVYGWGSNGCSVYAGDFESLEAFSAWWSDELGRSFEEILNAGHLGSSWLAYTDPQPNPAALVFLQALGLSMPAFDPYDPAGVLAASAALEEAWLLAGGFPSDLWLSSSYIEVRLAPTSTLPVPEPGSLWLVGAALALQISCASRRSRAEAARRSGSARTSALRAAQARRPES